MHSMKVTPTSMAALLDTSLGNLELEAVASLKDLACSYGSPMGELPAMGTQGGQALNVSMELDS